MNGVSVKKIKMTMRLAEFLGDHFGRGKKDLDKRDSGFAIKCMDAACEIIWWFEKYNGEIKD